MTSGQNSTLNCDPNIRLQFNVNHDLGVTIQDGNQTRGHNSTWDQDPVSQFNVYSWSRVKFQRGILTRVTIQRGTMTRGQISTRNSDWDHNSTWNYDPRVKTPRWIMTLGQRASKLSVIKLFQIVILWVYYTIPFGFSLFWHVWDISFLLLKLLLWLRTTDEGSVPEMRIWSILLIKSDLKWCIHISRSLFFIFHIKLWHQSLVTI